MLSASQSQSSSSSSRAGCMDPLDVLLDLSEYEQLSYHSPSISPAASVKSQFVRPVASTPTASNALLPSSQQTLSGPSHNYDQYKQQTGIPTGAIANTLAMNANNMFNYNYMFGEDAAEDFLDFGAGSRNHSMDLSAEFDASPLTEPAYNYREAAEYINPRVIGGQESPPTEPLVVPAQTSHVGRLWPGMHQQQAALAKAQQQQKQQQQLIQQQRQQTMARTSKQRVKSQPTDPIAEEKISQLLNSMRQSSVATSEAEDASTPHAGGHAHRFSKEEEDMDEDERLLASEEGKKLSSKERRQLRNKVSARAFRSRRKEYIGQLESEIAGKVNENSDLRAQNRALLEENTRLSDLTRTLLASPAFSDFLNALAPNVAAAPQQTHPAPAEHAPAENRQVRKDVNPYAAPQQQVSSSQPLDLANLSDHPVDFSMLDLNVDGGYGYQPQVFSVRDMPEVTIDPAVLSGKAAPAGELPFESEDEKVELPVIERMPGKAMAPRATVPVRDEAFDADPAFALFTPSPSSAGTESPLDPAITSLFGGIQPEKSLCRFELVDASKSEALEAIAIARVERLYASLDDLSARLESMTVHF